MEFSKDEKLLIISSLLCYKERINCYLTDHPDDREQIKVLYRERVKETETLMFRFEKEVQNEG